MSPTCSDAQLTPETNPGVICPALLELSTSEIQPSPSQDVVPIQSSALQMECEEIPPPVLPSVSYDVPQLIMPSMPVHPSSSDIPPHHHMSSVREDLSPSGHNGMSHENGKYTMADQHFSLSRTAEQSYLF